MAEYIKREALIDAVESIDWYSVYKGKLTAGAPSTENALYKASSIYAVIDNAPSADVADVVRCKDCIRRYDTDECPMCFLIEGKYYEYTNENGFCDRGERKEGADNG